MTLEHRARFITTLVSLATIGTLVLAPSASAHEDHDRHGHGPAAFGLVDRFVSALNNQVKLLENQDFDDDDQHFFKDDDDGVLAEEAQIEHVRVISLATLTSRLNSASAQRVTNAVNSHTAALQAFLSGGSENATIVDAALADAGVDQSSALAILPFGDDHILVITA